jgi:hypothetical protein
MGRHSDGVGVAKQARADLVPRGRLVRSSSSLQLVGRR